MASENNRWNTPNTATIGLSYEITRAQPSVLNVTADLPSVASHQRDMTVDQVHPSDDSCGNTRLSTCIDIKLTPSTERLLENCKTNPAEFLRAIRAAKVVLPAGQGWKAAIATKKENTDIRDLLRIYHRFECYNLYSHVVEAGFHTGTHWVRDRRSELMKTLCHDFPDRFQNERAANKCLNWVDHGCKYYEWTKMFSDPENLGYLIALPSELPHSSYTSRCTREQMSAAAIKFKELGIGEMVADLRLSQLGDHIASALRDMTAKKKRNADGEISNVATHKSARLNSFPNVTTASVPGTSLNMTPPESSIPSIGENLMLFDPNATNSSTEDEFEDEFLYQGQLRPTSYSKRHVSQLETSLLPVYDWY